MSSFRLVLRAGPTPGKAYPLEKEEMFIGREANNDVVINDPEVSRRHARLFVQGGNMILEDLGSTNGTSVNGQRLTGPYVLRAGEIITLGEKITLLFEALTADANATMAGSRAPSQPQYSPQPAPPPIYQAPPSQQPVYAPPPPARYQAPPPPPAFSGQIPASPQPLQPVKKNTTVWIVVVVVILLFLICACAGIIYYIDANSLWCSLPVPRSIFQGCP